MKLTLALLVCLLSSVIAFSQQAQKIDEFQNLNCDEYLGRIDVAIGEARKNPSSTIYVLIYEGKEWEYNYRKNKAAFVFPKFGSAEAKIRSMKKWLSHRNVRLERFSFVSAGFREKLTVELWHVPAGATPPVATPTLVKIKYRKGRSKGFCIDCCGP